MQRMTKLYANYCDAEAQLRRLAEAGIGDRFIEQEGELYRVVWYIG